MIEAETPESARDAATPAVGGNGAAPAAPVEPDADEPAADIATVSAERDAYLDQLQRSRAEFANYRRRVEQERGQIREFATQAILAQLLPVLDDLQRALAAVPDDQRQTPLVNGISLIERKFWSVLERAGVTPIAAEGQPFDPALHEAVESVPDSDGSTVVAVYQTGYRLGQSLLRPAMVKVGNRPATDSTDAAASDAQ